MASGMDHQNDDILALFEARNPRGLARAISRCESGRGAEILRAVYARTGRALTVGLTGPPGVGKSTLTNAIVSKLRSLGKTVGVISVDPSSPFSNGALLGDRIRLVDHFMDPDVFIRSMASRGHLGGVAGATADAVSLMDAFGFDVVLIETVGVGQSEIEIAELADTTLVAMQPGSGDSIQLLKAGILEVADVFVVNKADHPHALHLQREIRSMMEMLNYTGWAPELVMTQAVEGKGIDELWDAIVSHDAYLRASGELAEKRRSAFAHRVRQLVVGRFSAEVDAVVDREIPRHSAPARGEDPYAVAERIAGELMRPTASGDRPLVPAPRHIRSTVKGLT